MSRNTVSSANSTGLGIDLHANVLNSPDLAYGFTGNIDPSRSLASIRQPGKPFSRHDTTAGALDIKKEGPSTDCRLTRQITLLESDKSDKMNILLGNAQSKLKSGAKISQAPSDSRTVEQAIPLERTSSQARVDLDIYLESNDCVQGGFLKGQIEVRVRKHKYPILLSAGKFRIVGFESIQNEQERAIFYQCSCFLSDVTTGSNRLYTSEPDDEGFARTAEGLYVFPFAYHVPLSSEGPKGPLPPRSGTSVRYIVMISFRIKDSVSDKKSIAHFYRDCSVWPRLDPSVVLASVSPPIQASTPPEVGNNKAFMTMSLHRPYWVAGQLCHVQLHVVNNTKKVLKTVTLELFQSMATFKLGLKSGSAQRDLLDTVSNACQTTTVNKKLAQAILTIGRPGTRGHASARGWWSGVAPGEAQTFVHSIMIPADALTIPRSKLLEVSYMLQVVVSAGTLLSTDTHVTLPLHIINFLSIDPPPSHPSQPMAAIRGPAQITAETCAGRHTLAAGMLQPSPVGHPMTNVRNELDYRLDDDGDCPTEHLHEEYDNTEITSIQEDNDDFVQNAILSARPESGGTLAFGDTYHSSLDDGLHCAVNEFHNLGSAPQPTGMEEAQDDSNHTEFRKSRGFISRVEEKQLIKRERRHTLEWSDNAGRREDGNRGHAKLESWPNKHRRAASDLDNAALESESQQRVRIDRNSNERLRWSRSFTQDTGSSVSDDSGLPSATITSMKLPIPPRGSIRRDAGKIYQKAELPGDSDVNTTYETQATTISRPPALRSYSVKEKIRELEERSLRAADD